MTKRSPDWLFRKIPLNTSEENISMISLWMSFSKSIQNGNILKGIVNVLWIPVLTCNLLISNQTNFVGLVHYELNFGQSQIIIAWDALVLQSIFTCPPESRNKINYKYYFPISQLTKWQGIWKYPPKNSAASLGKFITICVTGCTCWLEYIELTNLLASMLKTYPEKKIIHQISWRWLANEQ